MHAHISINLEQNDVKIINFARRISWYLHALLIYRQKSWDGYFFILTLYAQLPVDDHFVVC